MRRFIFLSVIFIVAMFAIPQPEAKAFDPVSMGILAPEAIALTKTVLPYVIAGLKAAGQELVYVGIEAFSILRLPLGLIESTLLAPWCFSDGVTNMVRGAVAPFGVIYHVIMIPIRMIGVF